MLTDEKSIWEVAADFRFSCDSNFVWSFCIAIRSSLLPLPTIQFAEVIVATVGTRALDFEPYTPNIAPRFNLTPMCTLPPPDPVRCESGLDTLYPI